MTTDRPPQTADARQTESALYGVQVLDVSTSMAGAWCSRLFADFGADVTLVEAPSGHPLRSHAPFAEDGRSIPAEHALANKRSLALDLEAEHGRELLRDLLTQVDVLIESFTPGVLDQWGLDLETLEALQPALIVVSVTPHGQDGARAGLPGNNLTASALSGWASINGLQGQPPLQASQYQLSYCAGVLAYGAAVAALREREANGGTGQRVDISEAEVAASTFAPALLRAEYNGEAPERKSTMDVQSGPVPVADGYFALTLSRAHFYHDAMRVLGLDDLAENEQLHEGWYRNSHKEQWIDRVHDAMAGWSRQDLFDELALRHVVAGPVFGISELTENQHLNDREFWTKPDDDPEGPTRTGAPSKLSVTPWRLRRRAPRIGEHTLVTLGEYDIEEDRAHALLEAGVLSAEVPAPSSEGPA